MMEIKSKEIEMVPVSELIHHPKNMNEHSDDQINRLVKLIEYQGFRNPLVVQRGTNLVVAGNGRLMAAKKIGLAYVPVTYQEFDSEAQLYAYMTSDNAIASWAHLDLSKVNTEMLDLGPDFDIDMLGIKDFVLEPIEKFDALTDEDAVPEVVHPITRRGDIWLLGNHRLMCGDSTMIDDVEKLMNGEKADMVFTDPPYNQRVSVSGYLKDRPSFKILAESENLNNFKPEEFLNILTLLKPSSFYVCCNKELIVDYIQHAKDSARLWDLLAICKANPIPNKSNKYLSDIEWILFSREKGAYFDDSLEYDWYRKAQKVNIKASEFGHPTEKSVSLVEQYISISSRFASLVLDLFMGSGTTLIACEKTGRKCYGMELDEKYCDVIIKRWEQYTGKKAIHESTGQTYEELKQERDNGPT